MNHPPNTPDPVDSSTAVLWGAKAISRRVGRSPDFVRSVLARLPGTPIRRMGRSLYALESDLIAFLHRWSGD